MAELKERTIEKEFVPYYLALELKELGFNEECFAWYNMSQDNLCFFGDDCCADMYAGEKSRPEAPLWQQVFRFFREKYMLSGEIYIFKNFWNFDIEDINNSIQLYTSDITSYSTYEVAEHECLVKLIEIAKEQNVKYI